MSTKPGRRAIPDEAERPPGCLACRPREGFSRVGGFRCAAALAATIPAMALAEALLDSEKQFDCVLEPASLVKLGSPVPGVLDEVLVGRGDVVEVDDVVARINSEVEKAMMEINRLRAQNTLNVESQHILVKLNEKKLERAGSLLEHWMISEDNYDEIKGELDLAESELALKKLESRLAKMEYHLSKVVLDQRIIRSPVQGVVSKRVLSEGEFVGQEDHILEIAVLDSLHVETFLPVDLFPKIHVGMVGTVTMSQPIRAMHEATVTVVDRVFDAASGTFGVRLLLTNPDRDIPGGHRCRVSFEIE